MMLPLVSVIIPNYNAEKYIEKCIKSVENQTYQNIEIIFIDDGSTDSSFEVIEMMMNDYNNIHVYRQVNLNASIARNRGIEIAKGRYIIFLDADDILYENAVYEMVKTAESVNADLVIGNYTEIDTEDRVTNKWKIENIPGYYDDPWSLVGLVPNPSNKLYVKEIIDNNNLVWGNVRIGQDLNFFLKYLACCKNIYLIDSYIYGWRKVPGSISNSFNFRIFDIIESFRDIKNYYYNNGKDELYEKYISVIEYRHYYLQMEKQKYFSDKRSRKIIVAYFELMLQNIDFSRGVNFSSYKSDIIKCKIKLMLKRIYISKLYKFIDNKFARKN